MKLGPVLFFTKEKDIYIFYFFLIIYIYFYIYMFGWFILPQHPPEFMNNVQILENDTMTLWDSAHRLLVILHGPEGWRWDTRFMECQWLWSDSYRPQGYCKAKNVYEQAIKTSTPPEQMWCKQPSKSERIFKVKIPEKFLFQNTALWSNRI